MHYACQFNAPLYVIAKLSARFPSQDTADDRGRYPIHVAVANGCEPDVIQFLIRSNPKHPGHQDKSGKTPLHYAGECYAKSYADIHYLPQDYNEVNRRTLEVVEILVKAAPESANVEDEEEMNPIEYAVLNSSNITVVKLMQRASRKEWRRRSTEECPEDLQAKLSSAQITNESAFGHRNLGARTAWTYIMIACPSYLYILYSRNEVIEL